MPFEEPATSYDLYLRTVPSDVDLVVESRVSGGTWSTGTSATYNGSTYRKFTYDEESSVEIRTYDNSGMYFFDEWEVIAGDISIDTTSTTNTFTMPSSDVAIDAKWTG